MGRTTHPLSFDGTWKTQTKKKLVGSDLMSFLKLREFTYGVTAE
jgi:hypothetical protein